MEDEYYQLGGYRPDIRWFSYDDKKLSEAIAGFASPLRQDTPLNQAIELVLGVTSYGSSHLLLTVNQMKRIASPMHLPLPQNRPLTARDFESLSPIYFFNEKVLEDKLSSLKPKAKKGKGQADTSKANKGYSPDVSNRGRGAFEHGRLFYCILNTIIIPRHYGVQHTAWSKEIEIISFVFNTLGIDNRSPEERLRRPNVLDIGFCETILPGLLPLYSSARHIIVRRNSLLSRKDKQVRFTHGQTETLDHADLSQTITDMFRRCHSPSILLVSNMEETLNYLRNFNVDTSEWRTDLKELLYPAGPVMSRNDFQHNVGRNRRTRSRSRSPHRGSHYSKSSYASSSRNPGSYRGESRNWRPSYAPVYVVDVRQWYKVLMQREDVKRPVDIALRMKLTETDGWCAGNEAALLIDVWRSMISGAPIDEQRETRNSTDLPATEEDGQQTILLSTTQSEADSDEEEDPNISMVKAQASNQAPPSAPSAGGGMDLEMSDYGSDDE